MIYVLFLKTDWPPKGCSMPQKACHHVLAQTDMSTSIGGITPPQAISQANSRYFFQPSKPKQSSKVTIPF